MRDKVRVGIIGLGRMGNIHLAKLLSNPDCEITAVYDTDKRKYEKVNSPAIEKCSNAEEITRYADAVIIASPSITHYDYLKFLLSNNIHCLCEKPPVIKSNDLINLIAIAKRKRLNFNVVMPERENPIIKYIMQNSKGRGYVFQSDRVAPFAGRGTDISVLYDIMIHDLDLLLRIIPFEMKRISATGLSLLTNQTDILNVRIEYDNGSFAILNASRAATEKKRKIRVFYKGGYISSDLLNLVYNHTVLKGGNVVSKNGTFNIEKSDPINTIDRDFIDLVLSKKRKSDYSSSTLIQTMKLCNDIEKKTITARIN